ncbi:hypothetical protein HD553DRAFT_324756 [Filobasidium floriforme]|uniref:uncharacterized protein n=1 Tax=Filobasidium floriforme TaxID=5210 RepID=UPI001E8CEABB|nr:uncharacterized protein HD553DRAFT_324756 [Filobasidium floriforme]KAH8083201.1 hypothetical protein HD553DRAFT_324756 [Filobasidium floriforme]
MSAQHQDFDFDFVLEAVNNAVTMDAVRQAQTPPYDIGPVDPLAEEQQNQFLLAAIQADAQEIQVRQDAAIAAALAAREREAAAKKAVQRWVKTQRAKAKRVEKSRDVAEHGVPAEYPCSSCANKKRGDKRCLVVLYEFKCHCCIAQNKLRNEPKLASLTQ